MHHILAVIICIGVLGAGEAEFPVGAKRALGSYNSAEATARAAFIKALEAEQAKATKANKLDEALAIRELIEKAKAGDPLPKPEVDLLGGDTGKAIFVGRYVNAVDEKPNMELFADGTCQSLYHRTSGTWTVENGKAVLRWSGRSLTETIGRPDRNGIFAGENEAGNKWTQRKDEKREGK